MTLPHNSAIPVKHTQVGDMNNRDLESGIIVWIKFKSETKSGYSEYKRYIIELPDVGARFSQLGTLEAKY